MHIGRHLVYEKILNILLTQICTNLKVEEYQMNRVNTYLAVGWLEKVIFGDVGTM